MQAQKTKKQYACLIFDADHTLLDYIADEYKAFTRLYDEMQVPITQELLLASRNHSEQTWTEAGMYNVHDVRVQKEYHNVYRSHVEDIFKKVYADFPNLDFSYTAKQAGEKFLENLCMHGALMPHAQETVERLSDKADGTYKIVIATNGITPIQRGRLRRFEPLVHGVYISEILGVIKPLPPFFLKILQDINVPAQQCLMVGDSLFSDIIGAKMVGMDCCWYNPDGIKNTTEITPDYEIRSLKELLDIL